MCNSIENIAASIVEHIISSSEESNHSKAEILSEVIKSCLLSDTDNPNHINGIDLFTKCDECMSRLNSNV